MVAPRAGAWIETFYLIRVMGERLSLPARERGLKHCHRMALGSVVFVAPRAGAWIETPIFQ